MRGVSVVVCCHNSAERLAKTLGHLAAQQIRTGVQWEVVVIDNASTDGTSSLALACWPTNAPAPLRVVSEPRLGLTYARRRGFDEAKYEVVSFVDDDNWVCPDWVEVVSEVMCTRPHVGACGGLSEAKCEIEQPWWFDDFKECYAVGSQGKEGDVTWSRGYLWGAGLTVRRPAWESLKSLGFQFLLMDREGPTLQSGGDLELCLALRLAGWSLWYEPKLRLIHYLPASRLQWAYLRQLVRSFGSAGIIHKAYRQEGSRNPKAWLEKHWQCQASVSLIKLILKCCNFLLAFPHAWEGNATVLDIESRIGELRQILHSPRAYKMNRQRIDSTFKNSEVR